ncbi:MAG: hypothetical protein ACRCYP_03810 [Alphaproteobacteria bacterium]
MAPSNLPIPISSSLYFGLQVESSDLDRLDQAITRIRTTGAPIAYKRFYQDFRETIADRYRQASRETQYAPSWVGTKQRVSGRIRGRNSLYGIDSGALFSQIVNNVRIDRNGLMVYSDLNYAKFIMDRFAQKGPFAPRPPIFMNEDDIQGLGTIIADVMQKIIADELAKG